MKKVYLLIGLLLYSTTPLAKTLVMECFVDDESVGITKLETEETNDSFYLITLRKDGVWMGTCHKPQTVCVQGDESVVVERKNQENGAKMKVVYDFKFLTHKTELKVSDSETNILEEIQVEGTCERINL